MTVVRIADVLLWGSVATVFMTTIMLGAQGLGLSRLSLPFLMGTAVTGRLRRAYVFGYFLYALGGLYFAFLYEAIFQSLGHQSWWFGALMGLAHGTFLLAALMHTPLVHPRMASEYDWFRSDRTIEPPGFMGMHYGVQTPVMTLLAHMVFGTILGATLPAMD